MFYVQLAPVGVILAKVSLTAIFAVSGDLTFFKAKTLPPTDLAEKCVEPQTPPVSKSKGWQMGNCWPKNIVDAGSEHSQMDQL